MAFLPSFWSIPEALQLWYFPLAVPVLSKTRQCHVSSARSLQDAVLEVVDGQSTRQFCKFFCCASLPLSRETSCSTSCHAMIGACRIVQNLLSKSQNLWQMRHSLHFALCAITSALAAVGGQPSLRARSPECTRKLAARRLEHECNKTEIVQATCYPCLIRLKTC